MPRRLAEKWEETLDRDEFPKIDDLYEFLYRTAVRLSKRVHSDTGKRDENNTLLPAKRGRTSNKAFVVSAKNNCVACKNKQHPLFKCDKFKQLTIPKRIELVKNAMLCYNCLRSHRGKACNYTNCTICHKRHNTLIHLGKSTTSKADTTDRKTIQNEAQENDITASLTTSSPDFTPQLMTSAMILVRNRDHELIKCRALLDTCASANFISESLVRQLKLHLIPHTMQISGINSMNTISKGAIQITIQSLYSDFHKDLFCLSIPAIADLAPAIAPI